VREKVLAEVIVVDSRDAALEAIRTNIPDVLLLSALLSPRDEDELIAHLRTLDAHHLQTHTIPQLASALAPGEKRGGGGLFSAFRRKKDEPTVVGGCDPDLFAEEILTYLQRAETKKRELRESNGVAPDMRLGPITERRAAPAVTEAEPESSSSSSSWDDPFAWKPGGSSSSARAARPSPPQHAPAPILESEPEPVAFERNDAAPEIAPEPPYRTPEPAFTAPEPVVLSSGPSPIGDPVTASIDGQSVVVAGEPSLLIPQPYSVLMSASDAVHVETSAPEPVRDAEPLLLRPEPKHTLIDTSDIEELPEITLIDEIPEPRFAERHTAPPPVADAGETLINLDAEPYHASIEEPSSYAGSEDTPREEAETSGPAATEWGIALAAVGTGIVDATDARDSRLGPLATWARMEARHADTPSSSDDLRMLLASLGVPPAVAGVRYPRGCRIRRVRVPAAKSGEAGESVGPVILSRRALAEQREHTA